MMNPTTHRIAASVVSLLCVSSAALADPPPGYYSTVDATNSATLRTTLHATIDDHTRFPYTSGSTDTWNILNLADEDPNNASNIVDVYHNKSFSKISGGVRDYNREHTWPNSYGFPDNINSGVDTNYPFTDSRRSSTFAGVVVILFRLGMVPQKVLVFVGRSLSLRNGGDA